jgi:hypothetical protein
MPNHCWNTVSIAGTRKQLKSIQKKLQDGQGTEFRPFSFNKIIPQPKDLGDNWYGWAVSNWGTKWNSYDGDNKVPDIFARTNPNSLRFITDKKEEEAICLLSYGFSTAWSPPEPVVSSLSEMFPDTVIRFCFIEEGEGFAARQFYKGGELLDEVDCMKSTYLQKSCYNHKDESVLREIKKYL